MISATMPIRARWKRNAFSAYLLQSASYVLPLVTLPYLMRVLEPTAFGEMAFAYVVVMFAVLFIDAGFDTYGARELSRDSVSRERASLIFAAITWIKLVASLLFGLAFVVLIQLIPELNAHRWLYLVTFLLLPGSLLFPTWLFQGLEVMHYTTACGVAGRLLAAAGLLGFVRGPEDLHIAAALQAGATVLSGLFCVPVIFARLGLSLVHPWSTLRREISTAWLQSRRLLLAEFLERGLDNSTVFVVGLFVSGGPLGVYAALDKLVRALRSLQQPLLRSLYPRYCQRWQTARATALTMAGRTTLALTVTAMLTAATAGASAPWLLALLFGALAPDQVMVFRTLCVWLFFSMLNGVLGQLWLLPAGHRNAFSNITVAGSVIQLSAILLGAVQAGVNGVAAALVGSEVLRTIALSAITATRFTDSGRRFSCTS